MLLFATIFILALASQIASLPVGQPSAESIEVAKRQNIETPVVNITDLDLADISPIEDGFLEADNDSGGETGDGGDAVSVANSYIPGSSVGTGQSAQNPNGVEGTSAACSLTGCASSSAAANNQSTTSSSSSSGLVNGGLINGGLININTTKRGLRRFFY